MLAPRESEEVGAAAFGPFVLPYRGVADRAASPVAFYLDRSGQTWGAITGDFFVWPYGHFKAVVATFIGAGFFQGVEQIAGQIKNSGKCGPVGNGVSPGIIGEALLGLLILPLIHG